MSISYQLGSLPKVIQLPSGFSIDESGTQGSLLVLAALIGFRVLHLGFPERDSDSQTCSASESGLKDCNRHFSNRKQDSMFGITPR